MKTSAKKGKFAIVGSHSDDVWQPPVFYISQLHNETGWCVLFYCVDQKFQDQHIPFTLALLLLLVWDTFGVFLSLDIHYAIFWNVVRWYCTLKCVFDLAGFNITFITNCSVATTKRMTKWYFKGFYFEILHQNVLMMSVWDSELANWQCEVKFVRLGLIVHTEE